YRVFKHPDTKTKLFFNLFDHQQHNPKEHHHQLPSTAPDNQIAKTSASEAKPSTIAWVEGKK
ncbi:hypothetical protein, partial [Acidovorax sp. NB1]|uniref:hypothetical protein n=1 Tax=Acidovorax sp. NB1 TaxID=1943571 RepID=UPI001BB22D4C